MGNIVSDKFGDFRDWYTDKTSDSYWIGANVPGGILLDKNAGTAEKIFGTVGWHTIGSGLRTAREAAETAQTEAERARAAGEQARLLLSQGEQQSLGYAQQGQDAAMGEYQRQLAEAQRYQQGLGGLFAQEQQAGDVANQRLNDILMGGDASQLQMDPYYATQQAEGERAMSRAMAAQGSYGGGQHFRELGRFNQDLASQEYNNAIGRLMGLSQQGQAATGAYQALNQGATNNMLGLYGAQADQLNRGGQFIGNLRQNYATAGANALNQQASNVGDMNMQAANALAWGAQNANASFQNALNTGTYMYGRNQQASSAAPSNTSGYNAVSPDQYSPYGRGLLA